MQWENICNSSISKKIVTIWLVRLPKHKLIINIFNGFLTKYPE